MCSQETAYTRLNSGDSLNFGGAEVDFWGTAQTPLQKVFVKNTSNTPEQVTVLGASGDGLQVLFGTSPDDLKEAPDHAFVLQPQGDSGDTLMGWVGLSLSDLSPGTKQTTITFHATEPGSPLGPIKAVVVRDWGGCSSSSLPWDDLNANWSNYGSVPIEIDYSDPALCDSATVTHAALVANGADVVIVQNSAGGLQQWSGDEIAALQTYLNEGHRVIGTYATFLNGSTDNRGLAPLFGLRSDLTYNTVGLTPTYTVTGQQDSLFHNLGGAYTSSGLSSSQVDTDDGIWTAGDLAGAAIVASTTDNKAVATYYDAGPYDAVYISSGPEFPVGDQDKQFIYNAIVNNLSVPPSSSEFSEAGPSTGPSDPPRP